MGYGISDSKPEPRTKKNDSMSLRQKLTLGFSPCPNDTFIFDALVHQKIDTEGLEFEVVMKDVEELNRMAFKEELDITKLSYHAYGHLMNEYMLLNSGSALGKNCGPLLITTKEKKDVFSSDPSSFKVAIPGRYTTANFLLSLAFPTIKDKEEMLFSEIETAVLNGKVDAGLIIHENRFTYQDKGLVKIEDLGEFWERTSQAPIPLGGICIKRSQSQDIQQRVDRVIKKSIQYAFENPAASRNFIQDHAQEIEDDVIQQHIELYVNDYSVDLGEEGKRAVELLYDKAVKQNIISGYKGPIFVNQKQEG